MTQQGKNLNLFRNDKNFAIITGLMQRREYVPFEKSLQASSNCFKSSSLKSVRAARLSLSSASTFTPSLESNPSNKSVSEGKPLDAFGGCSGVEQFDRLGFMSSDFT